VPNPNILILLDAPFGATHRFQQGIDATPTTRGRRYAIDDLAYRFRWHRVARLFAVKERLFPLYNYLASQTVRTVLHCQSNIASSGKPLDVWLPITITQRL
jgi:hypothetical protein